MGKLAKKTTLITGRQPVLEALRSGKALERIYLQRNSSGDILREIRTLARDLHIPILEAPAAKMDSLSRTRHQGCIALGAQVSYLDLQDVISFTLEGGEIPLFLLLDGITDVRNLGAIARSAWCFGAQALILPEKGVAPLNEEAVKTSAGALEHIQVCRVPSLQLAIKTLKLNGIRVLASSSGSENMLHPFALNDPVAFLLGSEDQGVQPGLIHDSDAHFRIPMARDFDSLNVSVAAGIILYEAQRQRLRDNPPPGSVFLV